MEVFPPDDPPPNEVGSIPTVSQLDPDWDESFASLEIALKAVCESKDTHSDVDHFSEESAVENSTVRNESQILNESTILSESRILNESTIPNESRILNESTIPNESQVLNESTIMKESAVLNESSVLKESSVLNESTVPNESTVKTEAKRKWKDDSFEDEGSSQHKLKRMNNMLLGSGEVTIQLVGSKDENCDKIPISNLLSIMKSEPETKLEEMAFDIPSSTSVKSEIEFIKLDPKEESLDFKSEVVDCKPDLSEVKDSSLTDDKSFPTEEKTFVKSEIILSRDIKSDSGFTDDLSMESKADFFSPGDNILGYDLKSSNETQSFKAENESEPMLSKDSLQLPENTTGFIPALDVKEEKPLSDDELMNLEESCDKKKEKKEESDKGAKKDDSDKNSKKDLLKKKKFERCNIRDIKLDDELDAVTLSAQKEEQERIQRLQEAQMRALQERLQQIEVEKEALSQLFSQPPDDAPNLFDSSLSEPDTSDDCKKPVVKSESDVVLVESSDEDKKAKLQTLIPSPIEENIIDISSSSSGNESDSEDSDKKDDDIMVLSDEGEVEPEGTAEDPNNSGAHTNDFCNQPDEEGRVLVNVGHPPEDPDIFLAPQIAKVIKPHQIGGIRFLYDNVVENLERYKSSSGFGCILAHSMGLGKTVQVVSFVDVFLRHTPATLVLCIVPINTIQNWKAEFDMWVPPSNCVEDAQVLSGEIRPRDYSIYTLNENFKTMATRAGLIAEWRKEGGVLLMGYEMYRMLALRKMPKIPLKKSKRLKKQEMSVEPETNEQIKKYMDEMYEHIVIPGPDLVICDEGHRIKNSLASTSMALKSIKTRRRVVLTGYPLQNNLLEYWCMVDFVRPNYLGSRAEFCNMFERPISNGQCIDSTPRDRQLMRFRSHVLHSLLVGFVQRRGHSVLRAVLPKKEEHVLLIRMTPIQRQLYKCFVKDLLYVQQATNPLKLFAVCCKIWNHPDILYKLLQEKKAQEDIDLDIDIAIASGSGISTTACGKKRGGQGKSKAMQRPLRALPRNLKPQPCTSEEIKSEELENVTANEEINFNSSDVCKEEFNASNQVGLPVQKDYPQQGSQAYQSQYSPKSNLNQFCQQNYPGQQYNSSSAHFLPQSNMNQAQFSSQPSPQSVSQQQYPQSPLMQQQYGQSQNQYSQGNTQSFPQVNSPFGSQTNLAEAIPQSKTNFQGKSPQPYSSQTNTLQYSPPTDVQKQYQQNMPQAQFSKQSSNSQDTHYSPPSNQKFTPQSTPPYPHSPASHQSYNSQSSQYSQQSYPSSSKQYSDQQFTSQSTDSRPSSQFTPQQQYGQITNPQSLVPEQTSAPNFSPQSTLQRSPPQSQFSQGQSSQPFSQQSVPLPSSQYSAQGPFSQMSPSEHFPPQTSAQPPTPTQTYTQSSPNQQAYNQTFPQQSSEFSQPSPSQFQKQNLSSFAQHKPSQPPFNAGHQSFPHQAVSQPFLSTDQQYSEQSSQPFSQNRDQQNFSPSQPFPHQSHQTTKFDNNQGQGSFPQQNTASGGNMQFSQSSPQATAQKTTAQSPPQEGNQQQNFPQAFSSETSESQFPQQTGSSLPFSHQNPQSFSQQSNQLPPYNTSQIASGTQQFNQPPAKSGQGYSQPTTQQFSSENQSAQQYGSQSQSSQYTQQVNPSLQYPQPAGSQSFPQQPNSQQFPSQSSKSQFGQGTQNQLFPQQSKTSQFPQNTQNQKYPQQVPQAAPTAQNVSQFNQQAPYSQPQLSQQYSAQVPQTQQYGQSSSQSPQQYLQQDQPAQQYTQQAPSSVLQGGQNFPGTNTHQRFPQPATQSSQDFNQQQSQPSESFNQSSLQPSQQYNHAAGQSTQFNPQSNQSQQFPQQSNPSTQIYNQQMNASSTYKQGQTSQQYNQPAPQQYSQNSQSNQQYNQMSGQSTQYTAKPIQNTQQYSQQSSQQYSQQPQCQPTQQYGQQPTQSSQQFSQPIPSPQQYTQPLQASQQFSQPAQSPQQFSQPAQSPQQFSQPAQSPQQFSQPAQSPQQFSQPAQSPQQFSQTAQSPQFSQPAQSPQQFPQPAQSPQFSQTSQSPQQFPQPGQSPQQFPQPGQSQQFSQPGQSSQQFSQPGHSPQQFSQPVQSPQQFSHQTTPSPQQFPHQPSLSPQDFVQSSQQFPQPSTQQQYKQQAVAPGQSPQFSLPQQFSNTFPPPPNQDSSQGSFQSEYQSQVQPVLSQQGLPLHSGNTLQTAKQNARGAKTKQGRSKLMSQQSLLPQNSAQHSQAPLKQQPFSGQGFQNGSPSSNVSQRPLGQQAAKPLQGSGTNFPPLNSPNPHQDNFSLQPVKPDTPGMFAAKCSKAVLQGKQINTPDASSVQQLPQNPLKPETVPMETDQQSNTGSDATVVPFRDRMDSSINYEWAIPIMKEYVLGVLENSHKMMVLFVIIAETLHQGDKLLVFSQSLSTLDLLEHFLSKIQVPRKPDEPEQLPNETWCRNKNYFRLDGSTSAQEREKLINEFNRNDNVSLFLLSTRAGCLGINLVGANRIVVMDASWNPCHDAQAVCRIYRYGQKKQCHIYRLVTDNSLEKRIYDRQVNKQGMSDRVVDELNPESNFTWKDVTTLIQDDEDDGPIQELSKFATSYSDKVLKYLVQEMSPSLSKEPFEHESLLLDRKDLKLTKQEKRLAKQSYEMAKRANMINIRTTYTYLPAGTAGGGQIIINNKQCQWVGGTTIRVLPNQSTSGGNVRPGTTATPITASPSLMSSLFKQGVMVQKLTMPSNVSIPVLTPGAPPVVIPAGQDVLVLRTPKGVYLRLPDGRIIAVQLPPSLLAKTQFRPNVVTHFRPAAPKGGTQPSTVINTPRGQSIGIIKQTLQCGGTVRYLGPRNASGNTAQNSARGSAPEVIDLSDDDEPVRKSASASNASTNSSESDSGSMDQDKFESNLKPTLMSGKHLTIRKISPNSPQSLSSLKEKCDIPQVLSKNKQITIMPINPTTQQNRQKVAPQLAQPVRVQQMLLHPQQGKKKVFQKGTSKVQMTPMFVSKSMRPQITITQPTPLHSNVHSLKSSQVNNQEPQKDSDFMENVNETHRNSPAKQNEESSNAPSDKDLSPNVISSLQAQNVPQGMPKGISISLSEPTKSTAVTLPDSLASITSKLNPNLQISPVEQPSASDLLPQKNVFHSNSAMQAVSSTSSQQNQIIHTAQSPHSMCKSPQLSSKTESPVQNIYGLKSSSQSQNNFSVSQANVVPSSISNPVQTSDQPFQYPLTSQTNIHQMQPKLLGEQQSVQYTSQTSTSQNPQLTITPHQPQAVSINQQMASRKKKSANKSTSKKPDSSLMTPNHPLQSQVQEPTPQFRHSQLPNHHLPENHFPSFSHMSGPEFPAFSNFSSHKPASHIQHPQPLHPLQHQEHALPPHLQHMSHMYPMSPHLTGTPSLTDMQPIAPRAWPVPQPAVSSFHPFSQSSSFYSSGQESSQFSFHPSPFSLPSLAPNSNQSESNINSGSEGDKASHVNSSNL